MDKTIYNIDYWNTMIRQNSTSAELISRIRWDFVSRIKPKTVLDYGSGPGWFSAFSPKDIKVDTFDIAPWPQTGINRKYYDLITMWDVIEHIPDLKILNSLLNSTKAVALATPVLPKGKSLITWKHYKPGEHVNLFNKQSLQEYFRKFGFRLVKSGYPECDCGIRQDIFSALFKKKTIVFTNGCFDILHSGHLQLLKKARSMGDRLVVAIDSDEHVKSLGKIPPRPINNQEFRMNVLKSIKWIDEVVVFDNLEKVLKKVRPDVLVKGGDYTVDKVVGKDLVESWGGEIKIIPFVEGNSTTAIINKIRSL